MKNVRSYFGFQTFFSCLVILTWHFGIWICLDIKPIKFDFYRVWPDCTPDIFFCLNLVFHTSLCRLARYSHQIWGMNLYWHNTEFSFTFVSFYVHFCILSGVTPLWNLLGPVGDMYCFSNTYSMLVVIYLLFYKQRLWHVYW